MSEILSNALFVLILLTLYFLVPQLAILATAAFVPAFKNVKFRDLSASAFIAQCILSAISAVILIFSTQPFTMNPRELVVGFCMLPILSFLFITHGPDIFSMLASSLFFDAVLPISFVVILCYALVMHFRMKFSFWYASRLSAFVYGVSLIILIILNFCLQAFLYAYH